MKSFLILLFLNLVLAVPHVARDNADCEAATVTLHAVTKTLLLPAQTITLDEHDGGCGVAGHKEAPEHLPAAAQAVKEAQSGYDKGSEVVIQRAPSSLTMHQPKGVTQRLLKATRLRMETKKPLQEVKEEHREVRDQPREINQDPLEVREQHLEVSQERQEASQMELQKDDLRMRRTQGQVLTQFPSIPGGMYQMQSSAMGGRSLVTLIQGTSVIQRHLIIPATMSLQPTPQMPYVGNATRVRLLEAVRKDSLYETAHMLPQLADELVLKMRHVPGFKMNDTVKSLTSLSKNHWAIVCILCLMSREVLQSIVQGTVGYDSYHSRSVWYPDPTSFEDRMHGIYVISLYRSRHKGEFLNLPEMEKLTEGLRKYIAGSRVMFKPTPTGQDKANIDWVKKVDAAKNARRHGSSPQEAFFISSGPGAIDALLDTYEERCATLRRVDPQGTTRQRQCPLYVGCSVNLKERLSRYSSCKETNKPLGLTMSILAVLDIVVEMVQKIAIRLYKPGQLPLAEQLVTTLAGSLVYESGFNVIGAGGNTPTPEQEDISWVPARWHVISIMPFLLDNLQAMVAGAYRRREFKRKLVQAEIEADDLKSRLSGLELDSPTVETLFTQSWEECKSTMEQGIEARQKKVKAQTAMIAALAILYPDAYAKVQHAHYMEVD
ncbi:hypothetical protein HJFPF1_02375 [Paramyrothecium foliicola]|nr:hypothetical protein HJFPF1_02375 [Paramyrothecium foliicola]